jgi:hypothetical protein
MIVRTYKFSVAFAVAAVVGMSVTSSTVLAKDWGDGSHGGHHGWHHGGHHGHLKHVGGRSGGLGYCDDYRDRVKRRERSQNPMVWNGDHWRSTLMPGYAGGYACIERRAVRVEIRRVVIGEPTNTSETERPHPHALLRVVGGADNPFGPRAVLRRKMQPQCGRSGPMILVWTGARAERACAPTGAWRGRIMVPSTDLSLDKG